MKKFTAVIPSLILILFTCGLPIIAQNTELPADTSGKSKFEKRTYVTTRTNLPPNIDGILNDSCWTAENWQDLNYQKEPVDGGNPTEKTIFKILYDEKNIYAAIRAFDKEPDQISKILSARDNFIGDILSICIDSYFDRRTSFEFGITAAGSKVDLVVSNGNQMNFNWNPVWDVKVGLEDSAWTAEYKIPLSQLRFSEGEDLTWGFMVWRWIYRKAEEDDWGPNPITSSTWVDKYGYLKGIKNLSAPIRIELLPYALGKLHSYKKQDGNPFKTGFDKKIDFGLDGKIGLSGNFTLDVTINPDFGQVEADPSQISLSSYELEYEEKRPFFIEGGDILSFASLFYPRRIGHMPSYNPRLGPNEYADMPGRTSILGAAKITGKTQNGLSIGILESVTGKETAEVKTPTGSVDKTVEPFTNYFVGRFQKEMLAGNFIYGGAFTAVNRKIDEEHLNFLADAAYTGGFDLTYKWDDKNYALTGTFGFSHVRGHKNAILRIQNSPAHYFQRPDADYLNVDSNSTSMNGYGGGIEFKKSGGGNWRFTENISWYSPNLEINDMGYLPQVDRITQSTNIGYVVQNPSGIIRNYSIYFDQGSTWNYGFDNYEFDLGFYTNITFINRWYIHADLFRDFPALNPSMVWGGPLFKHDGAWSYELSFGSDNTKPFSFDFEYENRFNADGISKQTELSPSFDFRITNALTFSGNFTYEFTRDNLQYITTEVRNNKYYYFLGMVDQYVYGFTARISLHITPDLSIQYYGSPFSAARKFSAIKKALDPRADKYESRFYEFTPDQISFDDKNKSYLINEGGNTFSIHNPDMSFREFRSNLVLKWEYSPGSTIYFVWSQNRSGVFNYGGSSFGNAFGKVFDIYPDNIFMLKINHWFSL